MSFHYFSHKNVNHSRYIFLDWNHAIRFLGQPNKWTCHQKGRKNEKTTETCKTL